jgi:hypothetical protein
MDTDANEKVGKNFKVREFACKDGSQAVFIDSYLVSILDILRNTIGKPVYINSGYRTPTRNKAVGGSKYSYHIRGMAADIRVENMTAKEIAKELDKIIPNECGIIVYNTWVHIDTRTKKIQKGGVKMALIKVKDLQEALRLIKQVLEMLDKIYHAVVEEKK